MMASITQNDPNWRFVTLFVRSGHSYRQHEGSHRRNRKKAEEGACCQYGVQSPSVINIAESVSQGICLLPAWTSCFRFGLKWNLWIYEMKSGWRGGSIGRALGGLKRSKGPRFESRQEHKNTASFSESKMLCWLHVVDVPPTPLCIRTHKNDHVGTLKILSVVHIRVRWITDTQKDPACSLLTGG